LAAEIRRKSFLFPVAAKFLAKQHKYGVKAFGARQLAAAFPAEACFRSLVPGGLSPSGSGVALGWYITPRPLSQISLPITKFRALPTFADPTCYFPNINTLNISSRCRSI
jgi:hypothetical protein